MTTTKAVRFWVSAAIVMALVAVLLWYGPIPQPLRYHDFADKRPLLGIPNAGDVLSNLGFTLAGLWGLVVWVRWRRRGDDPWSSCGYFLFFAALALTGLGSGYYHWSPDNPRLVWDRMHPARMRRPARRGPCRHPRAEASVGHRVGTRGGGRGERVVVVIYGQGR